MRERDGGAQRRKVYFYHLLIRVIFGKSKAGESFAYAFHSVFVRFFVHGENAVFRAAFYSHIAHGEPVVHRKAFNALSAEFYALVKRSVHANHSYDVQNEVFAGNALVQFAFQLKLDGGGNFKPYLAAHHYSRYIRGAYARGERAQSAVSAGVGIRAYHHRPRPGYAFFGQKRMLDAHFSHVEEVFNVIFAGKVAHALALLSGLYVPVGSKVVEHESYVVLIAKSASAALENVYGDGRGDVVGHSRVHVNQDEIACSQLFFGFFCTHTLFCRQNLLRKCKFHSFSFSNYFIL